VSSSARSIPDSPKSSLLRNRRQTSKALRRISASAGTGYVHGNEQRASRSRAMHASYARPTAICASTGSPA
jgi:hypothetical protein